MSSRNSFCLPSPGIPNFLLLHKIVNEELPPIIATIEIVSNHLDFFFVGFVSNSIPISISITAFNASAIKKS